MKTFEEILEETKIERQGKLSTIYWHTTILKANEKFMKQFEVKNLVQPDVSGNEALRVALAKIKKLEAKIVEKDKLLMEFVVELIKR